MTDSDAILDAVGEGVATISFNRPDKLNALTPAMLQKFFAKVDAAASDTSVHGILITGVGREFSAGLDLSVIGGGVSNDPGQSAVAQGVGRPGNCHADNRPGAKQRLVDVQALAKFRAGLKRPGGFSAQKDIYYAQASFCP